MRPLSLVFLPALLALSWSGLALADSHTADPAVDGMQRELDVAIERAADDVGLDALFVLAGPTSMQCDPSRATDALETCIVTVAASPHLGLPAAIAQY